MEITVTVDQSSNNQNYIKTEDIIVPGISTQAALDNATVFQKKVTYQYFDGLGRPIQQIAVKETPAFSDLITPIEYDALGRTPKEYLPYANLACGGYRGAAISEQASFYSTSIGTYNSRIKTDNAPYSSLVYENSPLNRVLQQGSPGVVWQPDQYNPIGSSNKA
ncbi:MAG: DUF6443 domain-containing protein, partial [Flammeovirgaceae bacterium]